MLTRLFAAAVLLLVLPLPTWAQGTPMPFVRAQFFDHNGDPCAGCLLNVYAAGTTTRVDTYTVIALTAGLENTNPIVLDSAGRPTSGYIYLAASSYRFVLTDSTGGTTYWDSDNTPAVPTTTVSLEVTGTAGEALTVGNVVYLSAGDGALVAGRWYRADADNTYSSSTALYVGMVQAAIASGATGSIRIQGRVTGLSGLIAGTRYYASNDVGSLAATAPSNARFVGSADSTTTLLIAPNPNFLPQLGQDLVFTGNYLIRRDTADAADSGFLSLAGGGAVGQARGGIIEVAGNEAARPGSISFYPGNVAGAVVKARNSGDTFDSFAFAHDTGAGVFTSTAAAGWILNSTAANGGYYVIQRSGANVLVVGDAEQIDAALGTNNDAAVKANAVLYLEATSADGVRSMTAYNNTDAGAANVVILADGSIQRSTSSARYKTNIARLTDWSFLLHLEPVTFNSVTAPTGKRYGGLLAEAVAAVAPEYAVLNADGLPDEVAYGHLVAPLIAAVQDLTAELEVLRARLAALEAK